VRFFLLSYTGKFLRCISRIFCLTLSRYSCRQISLPSSWRMSSCWLYHEETVLYSVPRRAVINGSALSSFMMASTQLLQNAFRHKLFEDNVPISLDIANLHIWLSHSHISIQFDVPSLGRWLLWLTRESSWSWNFCESRGDGKIEVVENTATTTPLPSLSPLPLRASLAYATFWEYQGSSLSLAHPSLPVWRKEESERGRRPEGNVGGAGGQEIWLPIHSIAPRISNQFPRSIANHKEPEILRCRFGTKYFPWFLSDDRHAPLTSIGSALVIFGYLALVLLYLNERSFIADEIYDDRSRLLQSSRYANVSMRFKYFVVNHRRITMDRIRLMYVRSRSCFHCFQY